MKAFHHSKVIPWGYARVSSRHAVVTLLIAMLCCYAATAGWAQTAYTSGYGGEVNIHLQILSGGSEYGQFAPAPAVNSQGIASYGPLEESAEGVAINLSDIVIVESGSLTGMVNFDDSTLTASSLGEAQDVHVMTAVIDSPGSGTFVDAGSVNSESIITGSCGDLQASASSTIN